MGKRKLRPAIELASAIGSTAFDLHKYQDQDVDFAFLFLWKVNPELFDWLMTRLSHVSAIRSSSSTPIEERTAD